MHRAFKTAEISVSWIFQKSCENLKAVVVFTVISSGLLRWLIIDFTEVDNQLQMVQISFPNPTFLSSVPYLTHTVEHIIGSCQQPQQGVLQPRFPVVSHWVAAVEQLDTLMADDECSPLNYPTWIFQGSQWFTPVVFQSKISFPSCFLHLIPVIYRPQCIGYWSSVSVPNFVILSV